MHALCYLMATRLKNCFLELLHKPAKLILYLVCFGLMAFVLVMQFFAPPPQLSLQLDLTWLKGAFFAFLSMFFVMAIMKGLSNGDAIFEMQDVGLLFVSPLSPKSILLYGLIQMAKTAFWAGFFLLFMGNNMQSLFGRGYGAILVLFFTYILVTVVNSILSLVLYNLTNGRPRRKRLVWLGTVVLFLPAVAVLGLELLKTGQIFEALERTLHSPVLSWTPIMGWGAQGAVALVDGSLGQGLLFLGVVIAAGAGLLAYLLLGRVDYYEDVLVATETNFEKKRAISEGQWSAEAHSKHRAKVAKTGVGGAGASAFLYKHLRETTRANTLGLLSWPIVLVILGCGGLALLLRGEGLCFILLQVLMWAQIFIIGTGRGLKETTTHYIYLIPESSFQKILWSNLEPVAGVLLQSVLLFGLVGLLGGEGPLMVAGCIAVFTLFSLMLIGVNYLSMRLFGAELGAGILVLLYLLAVLVLLLPGLVGAVVAAAATGNTALGLLVLSLWELAVGLGCFALSRGVLHHCDMQGPSK